MTNMTATCRARRTAAVVALVGLLATGCSTAGEPPTPATADSGALSAREAAAPVEATPIASAYGDFLAGIFAERQRDAAAAADYMARALEDDPDNPALLHQTFMLMAAEGRMNEAVRLAERLAEIRPSHGPAAVLLVLERVRAGDPAGARQLLDRLPDQGLSALLDPLLGGWINLMAGDKAAAMESLGALSLVDGFATLRDVHAGLIHDVSGDAGAAAANYEQAIKDPDNLSLRLALLAGNFYERHGQQEKGAALYRRYLEADPDSAVIQLVLARLEAGGDPPPAPLVATARDGMAESLFNLSGLLNQQGAGDIALIYARYALHIRPEYPVARVLLGEIFQAQRRHEAAIAAYERVATDSPFHYVAQLRIADELEALERYEDAKAVLKAAAAAHPKRYEPLYRLGNLLRGRERFAAAADAYARALDRVEEPGSQHWTLFYFRGIALERREEWPEAEEHFLKALELQPEQPYVMNYLAYSWVEQHSHLDRALDMLSRAVELRPEDGYIVDSLGWVHYRLGHYDKAVKHLERAVELRPGDPVINDHLGDAYWRVGRRKEARFQWHRALSLEPEADAIPTIQAKLEHGLSAGDKPNG